jgi:glutaredoxin 3
MPTSVVMYTTANCPYCMRARRLLDTKAVAYTEIRIDQAPDKRAEMEARSHRTTVPQIFIDKYHVGGFDDLSELDLDGRLDELLDTT